MNRVLLIKILHYKKVKNLILLWITFNWRIMLRGVAVMSLKIGIFESWKIILSLYMGVVNWKYTGQLQLNISHQVDSGHVNKVIKLLI